MSDDRPVMPRGSVSRTARLASLPLGAAGRATLGIGKRLSGQSADAVSAELQQRTAEQLFAVLGQLKGGAMKLGQTLSVFEAAVPEEMAAPYREALVKLQEEAPPMPVRTVHAVLAQQLGGTWRQRFREFDDQPAAAASIGQVHRATWRDGRDVAVKIQYPGAATALMSDLNQLSRFARMFAVLFPGMDVKPLIAELKARVVEELDYSLEADAQRGFAAAFADDPQIVVPRVVASAPKVIVSEWLDGTPLSRIIAGGTPEQRNRAGMLMALLHFSAPQRAGLLHADPHPGNFRLLADGRLGVIDFGATARLPDGHPEPIGRLLRWALDGKAEEVLADLRAEGFVLPNAQIDAQGVHDFLRPMLDPIAETRFHFTRAWMQEQAARIADPRLEASRLGRQLNLPPAYLLIHRVTIGSIGVLCQLDAAGGFRGVLEEWLPGFAK
ncbi:Predicted unusual protein kinase regulating ubiquinone biosynthesis, AarF/ABC1/UbiB family [Blastococcus aggregatus]|uniref:Predicted unusual protein kinase regulating ubiquinone biosynthesis, AarF/ABC1/UbiB family n=1 Tax=Blastococcus aggregatus TaxID=38502 RepID=A0A285V451_9ACTN|nr:AarF/ABC1/UbiB kinase family protein [Blastococcus aggregatus]SOC48840.1 Predicted unusual protein kinase regulating ubiquinone biosynthesis, AarF/ABC1/UbiB family [Blastococcus aggregatus]